MSVFLCGPLRLQQVMRLVYDGVLVRTLAVLPGYRCVRVRARPYHGLIAAPSGSVNGIVCEYLDKEVIEQIALLKGAMYEPRTLTVNMVDGRKIGATVFVTKKEYFSCLMFETWDIKDFIENNLEEYCKNHVPF